MPLENLARRFMISNQAFEGEFDLRRSVISRITAWVDSSKIFFLNALDWFWDQWEKFVAGVAKVFGNRNFHGWTDSKWGGGMFCNTTICGLM